MEQKNTLVCIGFTGIKECYLNISKEEAIKRYCETNKIVFESIDSFNEPIFQMEFSDSFGAYSVWEL